jgi:hypothetical protein
MDMYFLKKIDYICSVMKTSTFHIAAMIYLRQEVKWNLYARGYKML